MDAVGSHGERDVDPVVHEKQSATSAALLEEPPRELEEFTSVEVFLPELHGVDSAAQRGPDLTQQSFAAAAPLAVGDQAEAEREPPCGHGSRRPSSGLEAVA